MSNTPELEVFEVFRASDGYPGGRYREATPSESDTCIGCNGMGSVWCPAEYSNGACRCGMDAGAHLPVQCLACKGTGVDSDGGEDRP